MNQPASLPSTRWRARLCKRKSWFIKGIRSAHVAETGPLIPALVLPFSQASKVVAALRDSSCVFLLLNNSRAFKSSGQPACLLNFAWLACVVSVLPAHRYCDFIPSSVALLLLPQPTVMWPPHVRDSYNWWYSSDFNCNFMILITYHCFSFQYVGDCTRFSSAHYPTSSKSRYWNGRRAADWGGCVGNASGKSACLGFDCWVASSF